MFNHQRIKLTIYVGFSLLISVVAAFVAPGTLSPARAASTYIVNSTSDSIVGTCPATCTLRVAITAANGNAGSTITFDSTVFGTPKTITLTSTLPALTANMTITGPGASSLVTISGNNAVRVLVVGSVTVNISN